MMTDTKFKFWNRICALVSFAVSAVTYLLTIEPSASFWDCGEFIASSYKLEVGHPPGNPVFQLIARFFTMFGDSAHAAVIVNAMSALCSALTIMLLYLTVVFFAKRLFHRGKGEFSTGEALAIFGSGLVGALAYTFTDTFWFSAVEGEVYAMSSLFTALVFWAMTRWYDEADQPHSNRWIVLISFLMGLSIGVHLLNLLAIPALVFMFYYRRNEEGKFSFKMMLKALVIGVVIVAVILFGIIPWTPKAAAYVDLFFVNVLHLPYNVGAAFFMTALLALSFWGAFQTMKKGKVFLNTVLLCYASILVGFSIFAIDVIRSCAKTPTNEYQPDNAFTLVRYLTREQYGSTPLIYGQYFDAPYDLKQSKYWAPVDGRYKYVDAPVDAEYRPEGKMFFPRMWNNADPRYIEFYEAYTGGKGTFVRGAQHKKPSFGANMLYFIDYQLGWMYWRYFLWNFVGRQNDIHSPSPGNIFHGNWESGISFIDEYRLGDQSDAPAILAENKGKNHYYFLPLLLGLIGLFFQFARDKRGCWLNFLMFFMTGIAIVVYLNQPPYQVRERDYAFAGSFYFFSAWIGLAVAALYQWIEDILKGRGGVAVAVVCSVACLFVPALMAAENWDDHDRSNRATAVELASNYLESVGPDGILITHGDNDTFPVWYAQEVESIRTDVRICNTSLLGTDWHIDQMRYAVNESAPLNLQVPHTQYLYGTNEYIPIYDTRDSVMDIRDVMTLFRHPQVKIPLTSGRKVDFIASRRISIPVNKANAVKCGLIRAEQADEIADSIIITIPKDKDYISKPELFMLDLLSGYEWDRPIHMLNMGGDLNIGLKDYLEYCGYSYRLVPFRNRPSTTKVGKVDTDHLYSLMTEKFRWDNLARGDYFIDYQNLYTHLGVQSVRGTFVSCAKAFMDAGSSERALEMLDKSMEVMAHYPLEAIPIGFSGNDYVVVEMIDLYYRLGQEDKARNLASQLASELLVTARFYLEYYEFAKDDFEMAGNYIYCLADTLKDTPDKELGEKLVQSFTALVKGSD
ncbi:MAG: DUF2723 domain-containing protein [Candidatus Cryptobacteroides sp.]|nr:DUF2723 domain-containing protein [Candidatus Cryptobacteroides sp.]